MQNARRYQGRSGLFCRNTISNSGPTPYDIAVIAALIKKLNMKVNVFIEAPLSLHKQSYYKK